MSSRFALEGSEHHHPEGTVDAGAIAGQDRVEVTIYVRSDPSASAPFDVAAEATKPPAQRRYLSSDEAASVYGAAAGDLEAVRAFAAGHGLDVIRVNQAGRSVKVGGSAAAMSEAFGVQLRRFSHAEGSFRSHEGQVQLPAELRGVVTGVFGLDTQRLGRSFLRAPGDTVQQTLRDYAAHRRHHRHSATQPQPANTYLPPQVAQLYDFPKVSAAGQTVAVLAFNGSMDGGPSTPGGYDATILEDYFTNDLGLALPTITDVTVQGPGNSPGDGSDPNDSSPEVYLDLSIVGALATGAKIAVYFTEFTEQGWVDAITTVTTDTTHAPGVISISYGNPEDGAGTAWTSAAIAQVNTAFEQAAAQGKTITCASGDSGASDGESSGLHVDFPASSPWVLACGGTRLESSGGTISAETVWNDQASGNGATGGGISVLFTPPPSWQTSAGAVAIAGTPLSGRGVPDVSSLADPQTPFIVAQPGGTGGVGGTSAAAPLWASLITLCNASLPKPAGYLNPTLYSLPAGTLRDIESGNNAAPGGEGYTAGPGWDACTGLGSPGASSLLNALSGQAPAAQAPATSPPPS
jgi:kumamolisin